MNTTLEKRLPAGVAREISREEIAKLPLRRYDGDVCLVSTPQDLERAMDDIRNESVVGFDTETRPAFSKGESHLPCLAQAATARAVYLFRLNQPEVLRLVGDLLANVHTVKAGVALAFDLRRLKLVFPFEQRGVLDLGIEASRCGVNQTGLRNLAGIFLGFRIPKGASTSNWASSRLSSDQITYAATDAWACRELFLQFRTLGLLRARPVAQPGSGRT